MLAIRFRLPPSHSARSVNRAVYTITQVRFQPQIRNMSSVPGENFEPRQTATDEDYTPDPSKSLPLNPARQRLVDDILALYCMEPTIERVKVFRKIFQSTFQSTVRATYYTF